VLAGLRQVPEGTERHHGRTVEEHPEIRGYLPDAGRRRRSGAYQRAPGPGREDDDPAAALAWRVPEGRTGKNCSAGRPNRQATVDADPAPNFVSDTIGPLPGLGRGPFLPIATPASLRDRDRTGRVETIQGRTVALLNRAIDALIALIAEIKAAKAAGATGPR